MKKSVLIILLALIFISPICPMAQETPAWISFASEEWDHATHKDGTGLYWDIFRAVYEPLGIEVKIVTRSYSGAIELVKRKNVDAAVGSYIDEVEGALFPKWHFAVDVVQVAFLKSKGMEWKGEESLKDKEVGWIKGYAFDEYLETPVLKREFVNRRGAFRALEKGRCDFFMDAQGDMLDSFRKKYIDPSKLRVETVKELKLYVAFAGNERGRKFRDIFDKRLPKMVKSGEINALYKKWEKGNFTNPFRKK